jgi:hypothetical protein
LTPARIPIGTKVKDLGCPSADSEERGFSVATAEYYRKQAKTCLHMSRVCPDQILADRLDSLAAAFLEAAADRDDPLLSMMDEEPLPRRKYARG